MTCREREVQLRQVYLAWVLQLTSNAVYRQDSLVAARFFAFD